VQHRDRVPPHSRPEYAPLAVLLVPTLPVGCCCTGFHLADERCLGGGFVDGGFGGWSVRKDTLICLHMGSAYVGFKRELCYAVPSCVMWCAAWCAGAKDQGAAGRCCGCGKEGSETQAGDQEGLWEVTCCPDTSIHCGELSGPGVPLLPLIWASVTSYPRF
jgi:hypothetical protein